MGNRFTTIPAVLAVIAVTAFPTGCFHRSANSEQSTANPVAAEFATALRNKDRKSTRLNSSHLGISYAVFFLKNKIKENGANRLIAVDIGKADNHTQRIAK